MDDKNKQSASAGASVVGEVIVSNEVISLRKKPHDGAKQSLLSKGSYSEKIHKAHVLATPFTRSLAHKLGVDIETVVGTGPKGQILAKDVDLASRAGTRPTTPAVPTPPSTFVAPAVSPSANVATEMHAAITSDKQFTTPVARAIAQEQGIDLQSVSGTGYSNRVLGRDVQKVAETTSQPQPAPTSPPQFTPPPTFTPPPQFTVPTAVNVQPPMVAQVSNATPVKAPMKPQINTNWLVDRREKTTTIRKAIARTMRNSWANSAYTNLVLEVDVTKLWAARAQIKDEIFELTGIKITFLPYIIKALEIALRDFPIMNATYEEATEEIVYKGSVNMNIAVDTPSGLMVPIIQNVSALSIVDLSKEVIRLASAARNRTLRPQEMQGGTFTLTNYGSVGALFGVPVINYPQLAIAGVGAMVDKIYMRDDEPVVGKVMHLTVAADHRWIDGAEIGRFASRVKTLLENPGVLVLL